MRNILISTIIASITVFAPISAFAAPCGPFTGYHCMRSDGSTPVGSPQDAREDRERVERAEAALEEFRAARRSYEAEPERVRSRETRALTEEIRGLREDAERRARLAEGQRFIDELDRETQIRRARNEARRSRDFHVIDSRGNSYYGTVDGY